MKSEMPPALQNNVWKALSIFLFISFLITLVLFRGGNVLGGGEVGAAFYSPLRIYEMIRYAWSDVHLGITSGLMPASAPFYGFLGFFEKIGISVVWIQASFFFFVLFITLSSMYFCAKEIFPKSSSLLWLFSALIYLFNPYSTMNIWNRFLPNTMLFYGVIPLSLLLFIRGLKFHSYFFVGALALITAVFSFAFAAPAQTLIYWIILGITTLYFFLTSGNKSFVIKYFFVFVILWSISNFWWISQQISFASSTTFTASTKAFFTNAGNIDTFVTISRSLGQLRDLFLLRHGRISRETFDYPFDWPHVYSHPIYEFVSWTFLIVVLFIVFKNFKTKFVSYLFFIYLLGIFLSKGNLPPFGGLFFTAFEKFSFLQFFRNPYEKLGFITAFAYSLLFGYGISHLLSKINNQKVKRITYLSALLFILVFNGFPYFTGLVFTSDLYPSNDPNAGIQVQIPESYKDANKYLKENCPTCRFIAFPLPAGEGIYYKWPKGYVGLEQSGFLLENPGISHTTTIPYYGALSSQLEKLFMTSPSFYNYASLLNSPYVILRKDPDFKRTHMRDPEVIENYVRNNPNSKLEFVASFGDLSIYKYPEGLIAPKIYPATSITFTAETGALDQIRTIPFRTGQVLYPYASSAQATVFTQEYRPTKVVKSDTKFEIPDAEFPKYSEESYIFPYVSTLPASKKYKLILLKEKMQRSVKWDAKSLVYFDMLMMGKRLKEVQKSLETGDLTSAKTALEIYKKNLSPVFDQINYMNYSFKKPNERVWNETELVNIFSSHLFLLKQFEAKETAIHVDISQTISNLRELSLEAKIFPYWDLIKSDGFPSLDRVIYRVNVEEDGEYDVTLPRTSFFPEAFLNDLNVMAQIDDIATELTPEVRGEVVSFGKHYFEKGVHEISFNEAYGENLVSDIEFTLESTNEPVTKEIPVYDYSPFNDYNISFDYDVGYGSGLTFMVENDNDLIVDGEGYYFKKVLTPDNYFYKERSFSQEFSTFPLSTRAKLIFEVKPWNNCNAVYFKELNKCKDPIIYSLYNRPSQVSVRNIKVSPKYPNTLYLVNEGTDSELNVPDISFSKIDPTSYKVKVTNASEPFLLVFSEAYDGNWRANISDIGLVDEKNHVLVNGFANSWWIDHEGDFEIDIDYKPQKLLKTGYIISGISIAAISLYLTLRLIKKKRT